MPLPINNSRSATRALNAEQPCSAIPLSSPVGLAGVGTSHGNAHVNEEGWVHWIKEKVVQAFHSLLSCFSCFFCRTTPNSVRQTNATPVLSQDTPQTSTPTTSLQETTQTHLNQRIARGTEILNHQVEALSQHLNEHAASNAALERRIVILMSYNDETIIELGLVSEGFEAVKSRAVEQLQRLINRPENQLCETPALAIEAFIFSKSELQSLRGVDYYRINSTVTFNNRADSDEGNEIIHSRVRTRLSVEENALLDTLRPIFRPTTSNPESAVELLNQVQAHVIPLFANEPAVTAEMRLDHRIRKGTEMIDQYLSNLALLHTDPEHTGIFFAVRYNNQSYMTFRGQSEGEAVTRSQVILRLEEALNCNRFCENGRLSIQMLIFKKNSREDIECIENSSWVQFPNAVESGLNIQTHNLNSTTLSGFLQLAIPDSELRQIQLNTSILRLL